MATTSSRRVNDTRRRARKTGTTARRKAGSATRDITFLGRVGLAGRTGFYAILTALTVRIAVLKSAPRHQADANGALSLVSQSVVGQVAIGLVAAGFVLFGIGRLGGALRDRSVSAGRRWMTATQGIFYLVLAYVPASFLSGNQQTGSQQEQQHTAGEILKLPGGRVILVALGLVVIAICGYQIRGALRQDFRDGLDLGRAPTLIRRVADTAGPVGITARSLVFLPVGVFLIVAAVQADPKHAYGTDQELLDLSHHVWGVAILALMAMGLTVFVAFSAIETRYRVVFSSR